METWKMEIYRFGKMEIRKKGNQDKGKFGKMKICKNRNLEKWKF